MPLALRILARRTLLAIAVGLLCILLSNSRLTFPLDYLAYDTAVRVHTPTSAQDIALVAIDEQSLAELGRWPWPRERHVTLLRELNRAGVAAVAMDIIFAEPDVEYPENDTLLSAEISALGSVVLPLHFSHTGTGEALAEVLPFEPVRSAAQALGHVHVEVDEDGITRGLFLREGVGSARWPHLTLATLALIKGEMGRSKAIPGARNPNRTGETRAIVRDHFNLVPFDSQSQAPIISYADIIRGRAPLAQLADKVVFIGITATGLGDNITTPVGRMSGIEWNMAVYSALASDELIQTPNELVQDTLYFLLLVLAVIVITRQPPNRQLITLGIVIWLILCATLAVLHLLRYWISPVSPILALAIAYPLWSWLRLSAVMSLLKEQLTALNMGQPEQAADSYWQGIEHRAQLLEEGGYLRSWRLDTASGRLFLDKRRPLPRWRHTPGHSYCTLRDGHTHRTLHLYWASPTERPLRSVESIFRGPAKRTALRHYSTDLDIARVYQAFQRAGEFRKLVDEAVDHLSAGIIVCDITGAVLFHNSQAKQTLPNIGIKAHLPSLLSILTATGDVDLATAFGQLALHNKPLECECYLPKSRRSLLINGHALDVGMPVLVFTLADTTAIKAAELSRVEALNFLSHDLRVPLISALSIIEQARSSHETVTDGELLDRIESYVRRNLDFAENFTLLSRLKYAERPVFEACDAYAIAEEALSQHLQLARTRGLTLTMTTPAETLWVQGDAGLLERACLNLMDNAIKYSEPGGTITVSVYRHNTSAVLEVADEGQGIPLDEQTIIFEAFKQGDGARKGLGLGLRFVAEVARQHRGEVRVKSTPGQGSRFYLHIPLSASPETP
ncbi:CHASE2 domain-containing protein [Parahaliea mediterranea]|uniref:CHASE2 domain-containing protein n=1 Tax=Parahaliea mediterranea TaxID=651086 RepID=UPI000E2F6D02|nr:CHASE2 domain-containing protein [Parahaliea mediterranea]